ncbi:hypothetical protein [Desulfocurvibacter africanus]|uniref:hypothetical protein n=1 Tax=Desulfocurvibacter africanus TaxID=873 RepID=UPI0004159BA9|nr:hypothetical protein [Desulfocurvibacter africanus]
MFQYYITPFREQQVSFMDACRKEHELPLPSGTSRHFSRVLAVFACRQAVSVVLEAVSGYMRTARARLVGL